MMTPAATVETNSQRLMMIAPGPKARSSPAQPPASSGPGGS
jgi:hypothetical protein